MLSEWPSENPGIWQPGLQASRQAFPCQTCVTDRVPLLRLLRHLYESTKCPQDCQEVATQPESRGLCWDLSMSPVILSLQLSAFH